MEPAKWRVGIPQLHVTVPIRTAADRQAEALRDPGESPLGTGGVARMPHLEAVETLLLELPDLSFGAVVAEVGGDGDPTDGVHQVGNLLQRRQRLLDVGGSAPAEIARERGVHVDAYATLHQGPGYVGATPPPPRCLARGVPPP